MGMGMGRAEEPGMLLQVGKRHFHLLQVPSEDPLYRSSRVTGRQHRAALAHAAPAGTRSLIWDPGC